MEQKISPTFQKQAVHVLRLPGCCLRVADVDNDEADGEEGKFVVDKADEDNDDDIEIGAYP